MENRRESRTIKLRKSLTDSAEKALLSDVLTLEGVKSAEINDLQIDISYDFPLICFSEIWTVLNSRLETSSLGQMQRWRLSLIAYMQENEKQHLFKPAHWHLFVRDIHVHHHTLRQTVHNNNHKHLWRKQQQTPPSE